MAASQPRHAHGQRCHVPSKGERDRRVVSAQSHFSTSELEMVSPARRHRKRTLPSVFQHSRVLLPMLSSAVAERVQRQELVKREVISECFERQTCTIRSKFSVSLDGDLTNVFLLPRGWEVAYEVCSSLNFKKSFSLVKSLGRSFTVHVVRCGADDLNDTHSNSSEMQEAKTTLTNTVHLTKRGRLSSRWKG